MTKTIFFFLLLTTIISAQIPKPDHIVIVIEENHSYDQILNNSAAPYINSLISDSLSAVFTNSHGVTHPSQPNYLYLFSGSNQGVTDDNLPSGIPFTTPNLGTELINKGFTFKGYSEDLPDTGYTGTSSGQYKRKHNPWVDWQDSGTNEIPANLNLPFTDFPSDFNSLPTVSFVIPNQSNDMHNGSVSAADTWLKNNLDSYIQWSKTHNSLFIFTFDEDDFTTVNKILTIFTGQIVKQNQYDQSINHVNVLRTIENMYGLSYAGVSKDSSAITNCWTITTGIKENGNQSIPDNYKLFQNYPNPFNPSTIIRYKIPERSFVTLKVYDSLGRIVKLLVNGNENAGNYTQKFNADNLPSGIYFYQLSAGKFTQTRKALLMK